MKPVVILGVFVADLAFRTPRMPLMGETVIGPLFKLGPGGKGFAVMSRPLVVCHTLVSANFILDEK